MAMAQRLARPSRPPRPSAAVVLWRRLPEGKGDGGCEVFWIRRARALAFMGGWYAFPGGAVDRADAAVAVQGSPRAIAAGHSSAAEMPESLTDGLAELPEDVPPGLAACALRELLEETGVLPLPELFRPLDAPHADAAHLETHLAQARRRLNDGQLKDADADFGALAAELDLTLDASRLVFAGRWLTPPLGPRRFDNRFFLLRWPRELPVQPLVVPGEAEVGEWIEPAAALARWHRGDVITAPPILHILKVLAEEGPPEGLPGEDGGYSAALGRLHRPDEANLGPYRRIEFRPGVVSLPLPTATLPPATHTNAYLLGRGERVLIDPGSRDAQEIERLIAAVEASAAQGHPVREIWLTHHHPDHVGGLLPVARRLGLPIRAHADTFERLPGLAGAEGIRLGPPLVDDERLQLAGGEPPMTVRVLHTPGHARGHLCFHDETGRSLVAGDLLSAVSTIVVDPPEGDMDQYLASLERLAELCEESAPDPVTLFPGHGPPILDGAAALRELIEHRRWREEKILQAWRAGHHEPSELRPLVYDDVPEPAWPLAERQIVAHLERLERAGRL
jgi:glyoxylase-like metal-dependent hydrolase (beta-lactamase superfamily II)/8-oxo-dGTP pyrophosphatase MutT (NUDIX family)